MVKILHLFPKLLNLYGDRGNIAVLGRALSSMGAEVSVTCAEELEGLDIASFDFIYCGSGTENKIALAAQKLSSFSEQFKTAAEKGTSMLFTGSAMELTCREIVSEGKSLPCLGIFNASVRRTADRQTGDVLYESGLSDRIVAGFINKSGFIRTEEKPLFTPKFGPSSFEDSHQLDIPGEGLGKKRVRATYVTGPVLVRNPWLKSLIATELFETCEKGRVPAKYSDEYAEKGWAVTVSELEKRMMASR